MIIDSWTITARFAKSKAYVVSVNGIVTGVEARKIAERLEATGIFNEVTLAHNEPKRKSK
jgi:phosphopantothenate synthetase